MGMASCGEIAIKDQILGEPPFYGTAISTGSGMTTGLANGMATVASPLACPSPLVACPRSRSTMRVSDALPLSPSATSNS